MNIDTDFGLKLAVVGSRSFTDEKRIHRVLDENIDKIGLIISGGCAGPDSASATWAKKRGKPILIFYPRWYDEGGNYHKSAGFDRNIKIIKSCDCVAAFWDGASKGTAHSIELARRYNKPCQIFYS